VLFATLCRKEHTADVFRGTIRCRPPAFLLAVGLHGINPVLFIAHRMTVQPLRLCLLLAEVIGTLLNMEPSSGAKDFTSTHFIVECCLVTVC